MVLKVPASTLLVSLILVSVHFITSSSIRNATHNRLARQTSCEKLEFTCADKGCIPSYNVCDGAKDCSDGSDETKSACRASGIFKCPSLAFECSYGACIDRDHRCDGESNCADGSDEEGCVPSSTETDNSCGNIKFKCSNGQCINRYDTCDGVKNCDDGSDETRELCYKLICPSSSFQCNYGACLEPSLKCDGKSDCHDNSDEQNCQTVTTLRPFVSNQPVSPEGGCRLPSHPRHGAYTSVKCSAHDPRSECRNIPGTLVPNSWGLKYSCNSGYSLNKESEFAICVSGVWRYEVECIKLCPPLKSLSLDITCSYNGKEVPCDHSMRPDTKANVRCKEFYKPTFVPDYSAMYCLINGEWSFDLYQCSPDCGVKGPPTPLINNGSPSHQGEFPWLAALYYITGSQEWVQRCGGTLITPHIVLTAAHCLVETQSNVPLQPSDLRVGLGKYHRDFYRDEPSSNISEVRELVLPRKYAGGPSNYALDIGLVDLVVSVQVSAFIMPACVDWTNAFVPAPNAVGIVAGWGKLENAVESEVVLTTNLTYIGYNECLNKIRAGLKSTLTIDKFCGGRAPNGGLVDSGDSGGGLAFMKNGLWFLIGVVSTKIPGESAFTLFTDITHSAHSTWLQNERDRLKRAHLEL